MKKKTLLLMLAMVLTATSLTACSHSTTSTSTFTTSFTDENGETTTHTTTTTTENGETTTEEETTEATQEDDFDDAAYEVDESDIPTLRDEWAGYFEFGAEGKTDEGETVLFTYDDANEMTQAALMLISPENVLTIYDIGKVVRDGDYYVIEDVDGDVELPFLVTETQDDYFEMTFKDESRAKLYYVEKDKIIDDMVSIIEDIQSQEN